MLIGASLRQIGRAHRGLRGDERRRADRISTRSEAEGRSAAEDGEGLTILLRAVKAGLPADGK